MKNQKKVFQSLTLILQFGLNMIPFFVIGALAGFTNIYKMAKKIYGLGRKDRKK